MSRTWQLQEAKNRLSELVDATKDAPQVITRRGKETAVVLSIEDYTKLVERKGRLVDLLRAAPRVPGGLDVKRTKDTGRPIEL
jgi:prevent-host-death family protein